MNNVRRNIVLFADVLEENFDGVSVTLHKILKNIPTEKFGVIIVTSHPPKDVSKLPFKVVVCPYLKVPFQRGYRMGIPNSKKLTAELDKFQPDLIHFTSPSPFAVFAIKYGKKRNVPVVNIYHTHYPVYLRYYIGRLGDFLFGKFIKYLFTWFYRNSDMTLVPTKPIKMDLIKLGIKKEKLKIWGRAIEAGAFKPDYRDENLFDIVVPKGNKKVLFVSRLIKEKETATLYKVYKKLVKTNPNISMIITGDGPKRDWLEARMPKAIFTGKKEGEELAKIYASCDVFFFPSASETFGNVIIEAMASGLPVVSANAGGPSELIRDKKTGFLVQTGSANAFCKKILLLTGDDELRREMGNNAREYVKSRPIDILHNQLWIAYENLINQFGKSESETVNSSVESSELGPTMCSATFL